MAEIRLGKAASEFNVSTQTIIESLQKKGFAIENKPTAKLTEEMYSYISSVFSSDKEAKEQSKSIGLKLKKREDAVKTEEAAPKVKAEEKPVTTEPEVKSKSVVEESNS
jgi:translation initiation factor IF-2